MLIVCIGIFIVVGSIIGLGFLGICLIVGIFQALADEFGKDGSK